MSSPQDLHKIASLQRPLSGSCGPDDVPSKTNGALIKTIDSKSGTLPQELPQPPSRPQTISTPSPSAAMAPSRAGTLSWQQRPSSRGSTGSNSRPLSMVASGNYASTAPRGAVDRTSAIDGSVSRSQISQSIGSKDPAWFKQTQDRGLGSAALRRNPDDVSDPALMIGSKRLPGMSRESTADHEDHASSASDCDRSVSPPREESIRGISGLSHNYSGSASLASGGGMGSPLPTMSSQRFEPPTNPRSSMGENSSTAQTLAMSPSQGRLSPERLDRPTSPTKGLGGFVQSAMLKRSDSVNKRWSAQAGPMLSRGNSITSNRSGYEGTKYPMSGITSLKDSRPSSISREYSTETSSRPASSHSNATLSQGQIENERTSGPIPLASIKSGPFRDEVSKPAHVDSQPSPLSNHNNNAQMMSPPASPSKKWSPPKASWLESAFNKPDTPKIMSPASQQPAWMAEINRAKQQRGSIDLLRGGSLTEESTSRLVRSPPLPADYKPPGISGLPTGLNARISTKPQVESPESVSQQFESPKTTNDNDHIQASNSSHTAQMEPETKANSSRIPPADTKKLADSPSAKGSESQLGSRTQSPKARPGSPPKIDFKSRLKSRQASGEAKSKDEPEFKNVFGNLKRTQTQNYKAPNELRDNILRGKAGLAMTGNPKRTERKDDFKESILKKKEGMVVPSASTRITSASAKFHENNVPEAIARRQGLTRSQSSLSKDSTERASEPTKAEALEKLQNLRDRPRSIPPETPPSTVAELEETPVTKGSPGGEFTSSLAGMLRRGPLAMVNGGKPSIENSFSDDQDLHSEGMRNDEEAAAAGPQLKHATKARARGPKRRLPTASNAEQDTSPSQREPQSNSSIIDIRPSTLNAKSAVIPQHVSKPEPRPLSNITHHNNSNRKASQPSSPRKPSTSITQSWDIKTSSPISQSRGKELQSKTPPIVKEKPNLNPKDIKTPVNFDSASGYLPNTPPKRPSTQEPSNIPSELPREHEPREPAALENVRPTPSVKGTAAIWGHPPRQPSQPKSPVQLRTRENEGEEAAREVAGLGLKGAAISPVGFGIETPTVVPNPSSNCNLPSSVTPSPKSPPLPGKKPASITNRVASTNQSSQPITTTPLPPTILSTGMSQNNRSGASDFLASLFDEHPNLKTNISIDTQAALSSRSSSDSSTLIKTLR